MSVKRFLDTNALIYAFSEDKAKAARAEAMLGAGGSISVQVLNEFAHVCQRKLRLDWKEIEARLAVIKTLVNEVVPVSIDMHEKAFTLARDHNFPFYDALIVAAALAQSCTHLLTEDMQHGRNVGGLQIENPFLGI
ncbi:MAG: PIN domain-containing protein [Rhodomicrobium sp.]